MFGTYTVLFLNLGKHQTLFEDNLQCDFLMLQIFINKVFKTKLK
jgi:hypothetical protein